MKTIKITSKNAKSRAAFLSALRRKAHIVVNKTENRRKSWNVIALSDLNAARLEGWKVA